MAFGPLGLAAGQATSRVERAQRGDTLVLRSIGPGQWGTPKVATEVLRISGQSPNNPFGILGEVALLPGGRVVVYDQRGTNGPALQVFDSTGRFVRTVGRVGDGPGEFRTVSAGLAVDTDGNLLLYDGQLMRVNRYRVTGKLAGTNRLLSAAGGMGQPHIVAGPNGSFYALSMFRPTNHRVLSQLDVFGYIRYARDGSAQDTVPPQHLWYSGETITDYDPTNTWTVHSDGRIVAMRTDLLGFLITGRGRPTLVELAGGPPTFSSVERRELQGIQDYVERTTPKEGGVDRKHGVIPERKPAVRDMVVDQNGRVWLRRSAPSIRVAPRPGAFQRPKAPPPPPRNFAEPQVWVAFTIGGTYLGEVHFPLGTRIKAFGRDIAWGVVLSGDDEPQLVKYRIPGIGSLRK
ncbi:MAG: 6-bladed beta-propeller [Gemmatimonadales bacterium]